VVKKRIKTEEDEGKKERNPLCTKGLRSSLYTNKKEVEAA